MTWLVAGLLLGCVSGIQGAPPTIPPLRVTLYYTALEADYDRGTEAVFRDVDGGELKRGSRQFLNAARIEGSARFIDGEVLNYTALVDAEIRWRRVDTALGEDARSCELVPFRSAAVDPSVVALGTILLIEATRGMQLPDGSLHDGMWLAADTGTAIIGDRIDLYVGAGEASMHLPLDFGLDYLRPLTVTPQGTVDGCALDE